ncbi:hypothetical protein ILYODFUR_019902 [Ilyodon furcidens]|uniref:Uncharacterized protein n=1 Tax=Ilyodon furcidens TaxID=33524 RepID=A0ABV0V4J2_9TELE
MDFELSFVTQSILFIVLLSAPVTLIHAPKLKLSLLLLGFYPSGSFKEHSSDAAFVAQSNCLVFMRYTWFWFMVWYLRFRVKAWKLRAKFKVQYLSLWHCNSMTGSRNGCFSVVKTVGVKPAAMYRGYSPRSSCPGFESRTR